MKEIDANKRAWGLLAQDHYLAYKKALQEEKSLLSSIITSELGNIAGKSLIHLQCNTGADTISLARMGALVTGVDLVPENVFYARKLARELGVYQAEFIESNIMDFDSRHKEQYDIVFTSEGAIGWLPNLKKWGQVIRNLLKDDGYFYIFDSHPFYLLLDEDKLGQNQLEIKYPYFGKHPDESDEIGGYASEAKQGKNYFWMYTFSDIVNALSSAGLFIEYFHEFDKQFWDSGGLEKVERTLYIHPYFKEKFPFSFSLKATIR
jgi:SAM-dependent methyltransferase